MPADLRRIDRSSPIERVYLNLNSIGKLNFFADKLNINETSTVDLFAKTVWGILRGLETFSQLLIPAGDGSNVSTSIKLP